MKTIEQKAKAYDEALKRAKAAIDVAADKDLVGGVVRTVFPEFKESEDERIIQNLIDAFTEYKKSGGVDFHGIEINTLLAYLEKQKEPVVDKEGLYYYLGGKFIYCGYPATEENPYAFAMSQQEKQKEQKPVDYEAELKKCKDNPLYFFDKYVSIKLKPAEWSEEEYGRLFDIEHYLDGTLQLSPDRKIACIDFLKSLRPQSKDEIYKEKDRAYKLGKHHLAIKFMNYLDENRPEGKMSLSNAECEDIDKAFKENDWAKIMRYYEKYRPHWKPSEEQMDSLRDTIVQTKGYSYSVYLPELYEQLKKLI